MYPVTRTLLFAAGLAACLSHCAGPARADTVDDAIKIACWSWHKDAPSWAPIIRASARRYMLHPVRLVALIGYESSCIKDATSHHLALGLTQILPYGPAANGHTWAELYDPAINIETGARWLSLMTTWCGTDAAGLGAYNTGKCHRGQKYARRVLALERHIWKELERNSARRSIVR